jgi:hypothetical protein
VTETVTDYYLTSDHADTVVVGEGEDAKYVPVGPGDTVSLSTADAESDANAHLFEGVDDEAALQVVPPPETPAQEDISDQPAEPTPASEVTSKATKGSTAKK